MANTLYKNYLRLCEKWGVDHSKKGRDLGEFIRQQVAKEFSRGEVSNISNVKECEKKLEILNRLASNHYSKLYPWNKEVGVSGLTLDECRQILSTEGLKEVNQRKGPVLEKIKSLFV